MAAANPDAPGLGMLTAWPLEEARAALAADPALYGHGVQVIETAAPPRRAPRAAAASSAAEVGGRKFHETVPGQWRVLRARLVGEGSCELLVAREELRA